MGGLLVLVLIAGYVWSAAKLCNRAGSYWAKALVVIAAILLPTADAVYGRIKLKQMCEAEGGLHVYRVVEGVEGFDALSLGPDDEWISKYGYRFVEGEELGGKRSRVSLQPDGKIIREVGVTPITKYIFEWDKGDSRDVFDRSGTHIRVRSTGEILSRYVNINYAGGWFERFVGGLYASHGSVAWCGPVVSVHEIVAKTLKPINQDQTK
jgi:hypothetical protein